MLKKICLISGSLLLLAVACKSKKDSTQTANKNPKSNEPSIVLDTINVTPQEKPKTKNYRASNTRSSDILHTKLEVRFDWQNAWLFGKATIDIKPYFYPTKTLYLNARGMDIYKVQLVTGNNFSDLKYVYENDSLKIDLGKEYKKEETYRVFIDYKSKPEELKKGGSNAISSDKGLYFINPRGEDPDKMPQIWTQGETQSNSAWFPTVDSPNERMTDEIYITVDEKYTTLSNGLMKDQKKNADGTRTDHWVMDMPHAPYLVMMAIGEFKIVKDSWKGKDVWYYVEKEYEPYAKSIFGNTPEMLTFFSDRLGVQYPWQKYSQIVVRDYVSGAMENTTATVHGEFLYSTDRELLDGDQEDVIAHELFHQWFGDLVTCESWSNLPLNESFATYGEYLWNEYKYGRDAADAAFYGSRSGYMMESAQKKAELVRFEYKQREDMFDAHSYNKGGQVLNMLRRYVGDDAFFASLKLYLERYRFQPAEVHMLRLCFEEVTGEDLNWFFNQWFYSKGHPEFKVESSYDAGSKKLVLRVQQEQNFTKIPVFTLPVKVDIYSNGSVRKETIWIKNADQKFEFANVASQPDLVNFDAEKMLLCDKDENKTASEYVFQYRNAPLYVDRREALEYFEGKTGDARIFETVVLALNDKYEGLRSKAIRLLAEKAPEKEAELKPLLIKIAKTDLKASVRADALEFLAKNYSGADLAEVYKSSLDDKSYEVMSRALSGLAKADPVTAKQKAKQLENESSTSILYAVMDIYANDFDPSGNDFFMRSAKKFTSWNAIGFYNMYGLYLKKADDETFLKSAAFIRDNMASNPNKYVKFYAQKVIRDRSNKYQERIDELNGKIEAAKKESKPAADLESEVSRLKELKLKVDAVYDEMQK
jgi:aminopeptidase N